MLLLLMSWPVHDTGSMGGVFKVRRHHQMEVDLEEVTAVPPSGTWLLAA